MIRIDKNSPISINTQIVEQIKLYIFKEVLKEGDKLDSVRHLSADIGVNPNTIQKAYRELELLGYVETQAGKGVFVKKAVGAEVDSYKDELMKSFEKDAKDLLELGVTLDELIKKLEGVV